MADDTLARMFWARVERGGGGPAQRFKRGGTWQTLSWREMGDITREVALGLIALGRTKGEAVGVLSASRASGSTRTSPSSRRAPGPFRSTRAIRRI